MPYRRTRTRPSQEKSNRLRHSSRRSSPMSVLNTDKLKKHPAPFWRNKVRKSYYNLRSQIIIVAMIATEIAAIVAIDKG
jgi:hypothetical protein